MLHGIVLAATRESAEVITQVARASGHVHIDRVFCPIATIHQLTRTLHTFAPDLVLLETGSEEDREVCACLEKRSPGAAIVGFSNQPAPLMESLFPQDGSPSPVLFHLEWPVTPASLLSAVRRAIQRKYPDPFKNVIAIMPSKAGSGASVTAINVASQFAQAFRQRTLLVEADLRSGVLSETLGVKSKFSIARTLSTADALPAAVWPQHIAQALGVDLVLSSREHTDVLPQWYSYRHLLNFAAPRYEQVVVDLPEAINEATGEVVRAARVVYIVTTPELPALELVRSRIEELAPHVPDVSKIRIVLNRWHRQDLQPQDVRRILETDVEVVLPNDYRSVKKAILNKSAVDANVSLGVGYRAFAGFLLGSNPAPTADMFKRNWLSGLLPASQAS